MNSRKTALAMVVIAILVVASVLFLTVSAEAAEYTYVEARKAPTNAICDIEQVTVAQKEGEMCIIHPPKRNGDLCLYVVTCVDVWE